jgi:hypothetical protein
MAVVKWANSRSKAKQASPLIELALTKAAPSEGPARALKRLLCPLSKRRPKKRNCLPLQVRTGRSNQEADECLKTPASAGASHEKDDCDINQRQEWRKQRLKVG